MARTTMMVMLMVGAPALASGPVAGPAAGPMPQPPALAPAPTDTPTDTPTETSRVSSVHSDPKVESQPQAKPAPKPVSQSAPTSESLPLGAPKAANAASGERSDSTPSAAAGGGVVRTVASLGGVLALIVLCAWGCRAFARRRGGLASAMGAGGRAPSGVLEALARYPISSGQSLVLLKLGRRVLLVNQSRSSRLGGASMTTLCEITDADEVAALVAKTREDAGESLAARFAGTLSKAEASARDAVTREVVSASGLAPATRSPLRRQAVPGAPTLEQASHAVGTEALADDLRRRLAALKAQPAASGSPAAARRGAILGAGVTA